MAQRSHLLLGMLTLTSVLAACNDVTSPVAQSNTPLPRFSGSSSNPLGSSGGGGGGGGSTAPACGAFSGPVQTYYIGVYTTRTGIGFRGTALNCGARSIAFAVNVVDVNRNPACQVNVPHFVALRNTGSGSTVQWSAGSTLIRCQGTTHAFVVTLVDASTGQQLATTTASAFL